MVVPDGSDRSRKNSIKPILLKYTASVARSRVSLAKRRFIYAASSGGFFLERETTSDSSFFCPTSCRYQLSPSVVRVMLEAGAVEKNSSESEI